MALQRRSKVLTESKLRDRLFEPVGAVFPEPPQFLYHYTKHSGLAGIISSKRLWAGNLLFMNDSSELEDGTRIFDRAIDRAQQMGLLGKDREPFADWYLNGPQFNISFGIFGVCFSELGDDLSQWRAYTQGGGYSLGFHGKELQRMHPRGIATLDRVIYDKQQKTSIAEATVDAAIAAWREVRLAAAATLTKRIDVFRGVLEQVVRHCICTMKHESFAAEREWRLFISNSDLEDDAQVKYRPGPVSVIPYVEIPIATRGRRILRKAIVGPSVHQDLAISGLIGCLADNGFDNVDVSSSRIPFRG